MDNVGSEIGNKMRSAVKAKLLELGTGDSAGYIDDELPDYIMIMIANKRSKQQMVVDLNLFLGNKTDLFVTWLHEVLQKLQEVTIPAAVANSANKRTRTTSKAEKEKEKKDKRPKEKKDKDSNKKLNKKPTSTVVGPVGSITDVFAGHLLEKAKKDLDITAEHEHHVKKGKEIKSTSSSAPKRHNQCDIPTISEISSTTDGSSAREKDLAELAEIQRQIYAAKKHLKQTGEVDVHLESEDEDFLNLKDDDSTHGFEDANDMLRKFKNTSAGAKENVKENNANDAAVVPTTPTITATPATTTQDSNKRREKSPILFKENATTPNETNSLSQKPREFEPQSPTKSNSFKNIYNEPIAPRYTSPLTRDKYAKHEAEPEPREPKHEHSELDHVSADQSNKRSIHQRLGLRNKVIDDRQKEREKEVEAPRNNRRQRQEKELYVPAFRRRGDGDNSEPRERERGRERMREPGRSRERSREREREREMRQRPSFVRRGAGNADRRRSLSSQSSQSTYEKTVETQRHRIGSRVIVAPVKPELSSESEEEMDKLNSVIKIKPRAPVSPRKQAPKNLLLRAVAEAQRSTILAKNTQKEVFKPTKRLSDRLGEKGKRDGLKRSASRSLGDDHGGAALFKRTTRNLMFDVEREKRARYNSHEPKLGAEENEHGEQDEEEEYVPMVVSGESDADVLYVPKSIRNQRNQHMELEDYEERPSSTKTQFVVTLNDEKAMPKYRARKHSRSSSPQPQVTSSSSAINAKRERYRDTSHRQSVKSRLSIKASASSSSVSPGVASRLGERDSNNSTPISMSPTRSGSNNNSTRRSERVEVYRKPKEVKKIIIQNDSEDDDLSPKKISPHEPQRRRFESDEEEEKAAKMEALRGLQQNLNGESRKRKRTPVNLNQNEKDSHSREEGPSSTKRRSRSRENVDREHQQERESSMEAGRKISIRNAEARKYDNIPALSSVALDSTAIKVIKPKERCKYHPNCTKQFCEYYHPTASCKAFPTCKYGDKCMYSHPNCKYDLACTNVDCNFAHSGPRNPSQLQTTAPPLSSHVVPVQNYKSISSSTVTATPAPAVPSSMCKYFPNCTKASCTFLHPKMCRYGKNCINPSCNYYHHDTPSSSKFKWVASVV